MPTALPQGSLERISKVPAIIINTKRSDRSRRFLRFRLLSLFGFITVVSLGLGLWHWWESTYERRELARSIRASDLFSEVEKSLLVNLVWQEPADELLQRLLPGDKHNSFPRWVFAQDLSWKGNYIEPHKGQARQVFVFCNPWNNSAIASIVVTDDQFRLIGWKEAYPGYLKSVTLTTKAGVPELSIVAGTPGQTPIEHSRGTYVFHLLDDEIVSIPVVWDPLTVDALIDSMPQKSQDFFTSAVGDAADR